MLIVIKKQMLITVRGELRDVSIATWLQMSIDQIGSFVN